MIYTEIDNTVPLYDENATYRRLWGAVLIQAIRDYNVLDRVEHQGLKDSQYGSIGARDLKKWLASEVMEVGSFCWICTLLDLEPGEVRLGIYDNPSVFIGARAA